MAKFVLLVLVIYATSLLLQPHHVVVRAEQEVSSPTCSLLDAEEKDPALKEFTYDVGDGPKSFMAYVQPDVNTFYQSDSGYSRVEPKFNGLAGKFINMSNRHVDFYWESYKNGPAHLMRHYDPFSTGGTGTFPTHRFYFTPKDEPDNQLVTFVVGNYPDNIYVFDPYFVEDDPIQTEKNLKEHLNEKERSQYDKWTKTLLFNEQYSAFTGRSYLSNFDDNGPRTPTNHFMWRADYFGQEHWVTTKETHFERLPPSEELGRVTLNGSERILKESEPRFLADYRVKDENNVPHDSMNMTLTVLSCAPRVFEIRNFLSEKEIDHIIEIAGGIKLSESTTGDVGSNSNGKNPDTKVERKTKVRTSKNSWVAREKSPILDAVYRRAADLTRIDEALMRTRSEEEIPEFDGKRSIAETLQLVHYDPTQEYTAHHDFGYSHIDDNMQAARFATILFYLNDEHDGLVGGETAFPRYINGKTFHDLKVKPEAGKAILFYDQLPDGNMDDFSQHSAKPVIRGEKWLINLWIWDPAYKA